MVTVRERVASLTTLPLKRKIRVQIDQKDWTLHAFYSSVLTTRFLFLRTLMLKCVFGIGVSGVLVLFRLGLNQGASKSLLSILVFFVFLLKNLNG